VPVEAGYDAATVGDVFTDVVHDEEMEAAEERCVLQVVG
jgi:hypothetical protein